MPMPTYLYEQRQRHYRKHLELRQDRLKTSQRSGASREKQMEHFAEITAAQMLANDPTLEKDPMLKNDPNLNERWAKERGSGRNMLDAFDGNVQSVSKTLKKSPVFQRMTKDKSPEELANMAKDPNKFVKDLQKQEKHYSGLMENIKTEDSVTNEVAPYIAALENTGTGRNWLGIKRSKNSPEYDNMLKSMKKIYLKEDSPQKQTENILNAIDATKKYLADKKTVRGSEDGQIRFDSAMKFLHSTMPPDEFKSYCEEVNRERGAMDPNHRDHITPRQFAPDRTPEQTIDAQKQQMEQNGYTKHDCAVIAAAYQLGHEKGTQNVERTEPRPLNNVPINPIELDTRAEEIENSESFTNWWEKQNKESIKNALEDNERGPAYRIGNYDKNLQISAADKERKADYDKKMQEKHKANVEKEQRNRDRKEYLEDLKKADPQEYQKLKTQNNNIKDLKNANPEEYEKQNKAHLADLDKRVNQHKKELQATHALDKESARRQWIENKHKELKQEGPQQQKKPQQPEMAPVL